jgi:hypothetical protein
MAHSRNLLLLTAAAGVALLVAGPASARTICRADGFCFNTSGDPIAPWQQPAYRGGFADEDGGYAYQPYRYYRTYPYHYRRHWRDDDEY